jgi:hypothetical protein
MLTSVSNRIPTAEELDELDSAISRATEPVQHLQMSLSRIADGRFEDQFAEPMSAAQAWHLTLLADNLLAEARALTEWATSIKADVRSEWLEQAARVMHEATS